MKNFVITVALALAGVLLVTSVSEAGGRGLLQRQRARLRHNDDVVVVARVVAPQVKVQQVVKAQQVQKVRQVQKVLKAQRVQKVVIPSHVQAVVSPIVVTVPQVLAIQGGYGVQALGTCH